MLTEDGKHLYVSYDEYHNLIEKLALKIHQSGWVFDTILCLARGGMRPGDILSRIFDVPLAIMSTSSYRAEAGTVQGHLDIARYITTPKGEIAGRVLLVDDLADTGHTLKAVVDMLKTNYSPISELRTAVIPARLFGRIFAHQSLDSSTLRTLRFHAPCHLDGEVEGLSRRSPRWTMRTILT
jgi:hypoxanthine phosphoribosyltransferase